MYVREKRKKQSRWKTGREEIKGKKSYVSKLTTLAGGQ